MIIGTVASTVRGDDHLVVAVAAAGRAVQVEQRS